MQSRGELRAEREIKHGKRLAALDTETIWGWGTPAGQIRAKRRADLIIAGAALVPGKRVLEIGCGTGMFTEMFAATGARIIAVDISAELLNKARARRLPPGQVTFCEKRFEDCEIEGPFDAVIGSSILHHLEIGSAIRRIKELLKPGGCISFAEPNMLNPQVFIERKFSHLPVFSYTSPDETAFVRWHLARQLFEMGLRNISIKPFDWLHPSTPKTLIETVSSIARLTEVIPLVKEFAGSLYIRAEVPNS
jgi:2-polyprenyl-3-methyl-5-hydroxy-6-metoxy-1,4-benzoquinol methylase